MKKDLNKILSFTDKDENGCLIWNRCLNSDGYPRALIDKNENTKVHRVVYELFNKEELGKYVVRHSCDNPKCINPEHLLKGTPLENIQDKNLRSGNGMAKLTKDQVKAIRSLLNDFSRKQLAEMFGVDSRTISSIILFKHWKHVQ